MTSVANSELVDTLRRAASPARAVAMAAYMRDQFPFFGIPSPALKALIRSAAPPFSKEVVLELWAMPEREYQYVALILLRKNAKICGPEFLDVARHLIVTKSWWDTVDELAAHLVGVLVMNHPQLVATMDRWVDDENMWLARTAILHQNRYKAATDAKRLFGYCEKRADHKDFFIRKAIGWALREYAKTDPEAVRAFVNANEATLSGLSKREALKNL